MKNTMYLRPIAMTGSLNLPLDLTAFGNYKLKIRNGDSK
jgi:hypothetical protein